MTGSNILRIHNYENILVDEFIETQIKVAENIILFDIIEKYYMPQVEKLNFPIFVELQASKESQFLMFLRNRFDDQLEKLEKLSSNQSLKRKIYSFRDIVIEKNETKFSN